MTTKENKKNTNENIIIINDDAISKRAKWYVVHTYSGHENKVAITLKHRVEALGFTDRIYKVLIPQEKKITIKEGKQKEHNERFIPGYVLVNMVMSDEAWHVVRSTKGVTGFVGIGTTPTPLSKKEVEAIKMYMDKEKPQFKTKFREGDSIKVTEGPFKDFLGTVQEVNDAQGKVKVLVSFFGSETPLELDYVQIKGL
jgi:transcriptional antiterminator NusG